MPHRIDGTITIINLTIGVIGTASGFLFEHAGTFASIATGVYMVICAVEKIRAMRREKQHRKK
ncbi:hypothetical protein Ga0100231_005380 [Opitutaceae bacterium TAV4]|nr:hypothetical protein Ga0100231_005380 [Opitutaceae bacterium TAV4]RRK02595.1 hypothetical protein Ga0100230_005630 [Opitutaceae bacterium TAV3]